MRKKYLKFILCVSLFVTIVWCLNSKKASGLYTAILGGWKHRGRKPEKGSCHSDEVIPSEYVYRLPPTWQKRWTEDLQPLGKL